MEGVAILIFLFLLSNHFAYSDLELNKCIPTECGGINITHPFYDAGQDSSCGFPGFQVSCIKSTPLLHLSSNTYIINKISYTDRTFWVVNSVFSPSSFLCTHISQLHNLNLPDTTLTFPSKPAYIVLLQGCSPQQLKRLSNYTTINCTTNSNTNTYNSIVGVYSQLSNWNNLGCTGSVSVPIIPSAEGQIQDRIRDGFPLEWKTSSVCSQWCETSGGLCINNHQCACPDGVTSTGNESFKCNSTNMPQGGNRPKKATLGDTVVFILGTIFIFSLYMYCFIKFCMCIGRLPSACVSKIGGAINGSTNARNVEEFIRNQESLGPKRYTYKEIKKMTISFRDKLGEGGYSHVYKGKLVDGRIVALKLLKETKGDGDDFMNEVASINRTNHVNVVTLLGFCYEGRKRALVYEFMPGGSLEKFTRVVANNSRELSWEILFQIALGIARGLEYLHIGCNTRVLHLDIKPHNILLSDTLCPKISDFGLAKLCPDKDEERNGSNVARGTIGYIAPEAVYRHMGNVSHKSDVYSYGMMILEMIGCRENVDPDTSASEYFPQWIYRQFKLEEQPVANNEEERLQRKMILVSLWCIQSIPTSRPAMAKVVQLLEGPLESIQVPPTPNFYNSPMPQPDSYASFSTTTDPSSLETRPSTCDSISIARPILSASYTMEREELPEKALLRLITI